jgi:hypothetical protein
LSDIGISNDIIEIIKEGNGNDLILISPFFPIKTDIIKDYFLNLGLKNYQILFSYLKAEDFNKNQESFNYKNILEFYTRKIKLLPNKTINLISFGIFTNIFLELALTFKNKINSIIFIEPDFSSILFKSLFDFKKMVFKNKFILKFYLDNDKNKINKKDFDFFDLNYLSKYYNSLKESGNIAQLRDLIDFLPEEIEQSSFKNNVLDKLSAKEKALILKFYNDKERKYVLNTKNLNQNSRAKLRSILIHFGLLQNVAVCWFVMARESWPLAQILEEYKIPVHHLDNNIYSSIKINHQSIDGFLKKYL